MTNPPAPPTELGAHHSDIFEALFLSSLDPQLLSSEDGSVQLANDSACRVFGYSRDQLHQISVEKLLPPSKSLGQALLQLRRNHAPNSAGGIRKLTALIRTKEGVEREVSLDVRQFEAKESHWFAWTIHEPEALSCSIEDLRESETKFRALVNSAPICIHEIDLEGNLLSMNPAGLAMVGSTEDDIKGVSYMSFVDSESSASVETLLDDAMRGKTSHFQFSVDTESGKCTFSSCFVPVHDEAGEIIRLMGITEDITDRLRSIEDRSKLEQEVMQAQKLESLGLLAGGIAHDFNNLLMVILGNCSMATDAAESQQVKSYLDDIDTTAVRAAELCSQLLAYAGKGTFENRRIDLSDLVQGMSKILAVSVPKSVVMRNDVAHDLPAMEGDASQIRQVIMNLIMNASDAIGDVGGVITISIDSMVIDEEYLASAFSDDGIATGRYVYFEVTDTGCGMESECQSRIFDPFYTTKDTGRGLGLAATLGIVRAHSGAIKCYSEVGQGTTFKALFPASSAAIEEEVIEAQSDGAWSGSGTILVADDEDSVRSVTRRMLDRAGFTTIAASDGLEAVELFEKHADTIRLVLLDIVMPHMDGVEAFRKIRLIRKDVPVLLSSGYNEKEGRTAFTGKGLSGFIQKPYRINALLRKVREVIGNSDCESIRNR